MSLRKVVLAACGQDVHRCRNCSFCNDLSIQGMDLTLESLISMVQYNDEEVLSSRTLWSDQVLEVANSACNGAINLKAILIALRDEAQRRGIAGSYQK